MKNSRLVLIAFIILLLAGCSKEYYDTKKAGEEYLAANKKNDSEVIELSPSGIQYKVIYNNSSGAYPLFKDAYNLTITIKYGARFIDDSIYITESTTPQTLTIIYAAEDFWSVIIPKMRIGSKWRVWVPYKYAFGQEGNGTEGSFKVDPYTVLIYDIELIDAY